MRFRWYYLERSSWSWFEAVRFFHVILWLDWSAKRRSKRLLYVHLLLQWSFQPLNWLKLVAHNARVTRNRGEQCAIPSWVHMKRFHDFVIVFFAFMRLLLLLQLGVTACLRSESASNVTLGSRSVFLCLNARNSHSEFREGLWGIVGSRR